MVRSSPTSGADRGYSCLTLVAQADLGDPGVLVPAIERLCAAYPAARMHLTYAVDNKRPRSFAWSPGRALDVLTEPSLRGLGLWAKDGREDPMRDGPALQLHIRDDRELSDYERRWSGLVLPGDANGGLALDFARLMVTAFGVVSGGLSSHPQRDDAEREASHGGDRRRCDPALAERLDWDYREWRRSRTKLRRLYPTTIIGPAIWRDLPPMPAFASAPTVEDLGDCKQLTAWPTLCDPRDPAFLRANRDLRAWLWPHTIENPADHVDNDPAGAGP